MNTKRFIALVAVTLSLLPFLLPKPAAAEPFFWGRGDRWGREDHWGRGDRWDYGRGYGHRSGFFFGIGPVILSPPVVPTTPVYVAPPPPSYPPSASCGGYNQVFVSGHWEYTSLGRRYWVADHYECR
jgi:hypothetical protein